jgi:hypothetical protein
MTMAGDLVILPMDADTLQATFPHWTIFEARNWWFALRSGECLEIYAGPRSLVRHTLRASSAALLAEMLAIQDFLDSLAPAELDEIYRRAEMVPTGPQAAAGAASA